MYNTHVEGVTIRRFFLSARYFKLNMSIKSTIAAVAATPLLVSGAAFAGPYVNLEATGSYPDGAYTSGGLEAVVGYEGETETESVGTFLVVLQ
ncbi:MAG: hypothetical protein CM15mV32_0190 [Caudoviricetes sp.]|nr:MAG: hypothetical protein CM15mV32_0190 [Caudoviricetes sp.]